MVRFYSHSFYWHMGLTLTATTTLGLTTILPAAAGTFRSIDGSGNNITNPDWGQADTELLRLSAPAYEDGLSVPRGGFVSSLPSARAISNSVSAQSGLILNSHGASDWFWQWGQFIDHDFGLTESATPAEPFNIAVPTGDPLFDPFNTGTQEIGLNRSIYHTDSNGVRQQVNEITAYIDASMVYGSDATRATELRALDNTGKLKTTIADNGEELLPFNTAGLANAGGTGDNLFLAGDVRANEQIGLTAVHTLFVREHNRLAEDIKTRLEGGDPELVAKRDAAIAEPGNSVDSEGDFIYESARKVVGAQIQAITYNEFLPLLLGGDLDPFGGYDDTVNAGLSNEFSTAAFRFGHTMLSPELQRVNNDGEDQGAVALQDAFFQADLVKQEGIDSLLLGLASQQAQAIDTFVIDDVRNFLFGPPGAGGFDLASLNIQRGRDHGLGGLNTVRGGLGLGLHTSFLDLTGGDIDLANAFESVYDSIDEVDLWVGGLAEAQFGGGLLGETFNTIVKDQFTRLRDGDRFFFLNADVLDHVSIFDTNVANVTLSDIIRRNSTISNIQANAFLVADEDVDVPEPGVAVTTLVLGILGAGLQLRERNQ